ncbi:MAG: MFS transporter [Acidihalobacter sp.]|uniref:MFS transporter n=1 Tax=Acidihalobacter sp. TaxID=1872108 RepID=UPI00307D9D65
MNSLDKPAMWRLAAAITISATVFTAMQGLTYPLLALILERQGVSAWLIGVNAAMMPLGVIVAAPLTPYLMQRLGALRFVVSSQLGTLLCLLLIGAQHDAWLWLPLRFMMGLFLASQFVVTETWINQIASDAYRGRILGFYATVLSAGFAAGPAILLGVGTQGWAPFTAGAALLLGAFLVLWSVRRALPAARSERPMSVFAFLPLAPLLLLAVAAVAFADEGSMSLLPIYVIQHGYGEQVGTAALIAMIAGSVSMQYPIGWLADRFSRRRVMLGCALVAAVSAMVQGIAVGVPWLFWSVVFVWGGSYYALHVLSLIRLGERFSGAALIAGNSAMGAMWGVGGIVGPPLLGGAMSSFGPNGLPVVLALLFVAIALVIARSGSE